MIREADIDGDGQINYDGELQAEFPDTVIEYTSFLLEFVKVFESEFVIYLLQIKLDFTDDVVQVTSLSISSMQSMFFLIFRHFHVRFVLTVIYITIVYVVYISESAFV